MKHSTVSFLILALVVSILPSVHAQTNNKISLGISPTYHEVVVENTDSQKEVSFQLQNSTQQRLQVRIFAIDIKQQDITGKIEYLQDKSKMNPYALASHITIPQSSIIIEPNKTADVRIIIRNDDRLFPGGHYAGIVSQAQYLNEASQPVLIPALTTQLFVRKTGGERAGLNLLSFDFPKYDVTFFYPSSAQLSLQNVGNIHLTPYGMVEVKDMLGRKVYKGVINESSLKIFPQTKRDIPVSFMKLAWNLPISINTVTVQGVDSLDVIRYGTTSAFLYVNGYFLLSIVIFLTGIFMYKKVIQKRFKRSHEK